MKYNSQKYEVEYETSIRALLARVACDVCSNLCKYREAYASGEFDRETLTDEYCEECVVKKAL